MVSELFERKRRSARCGKYDSARYEVASCRAGVQGHGSVLRDAEVRVAVETNARSMRGSTGVDHTNPVLRLPGWTCSSELKVSVVIVISEHCGARYPTPEG
jgi:hypothetical protein